MAGNLDQRRTNAQVVCGTGFSANKGGTSFHELALIVRTETKHTHYVIRIIFGDKRQWVMRH
jgi:hypothetical protein